jgi:hypothetical protein
MGTTVHDVGGRETKGGLVQVTMTLDPDDLKTLRAEAERRAKERKTARADVSELVRLAIREWIAKRIKP